VRLLPYWLMAVVRVPSFNEERIRWNFPKGSHHLRVLLLRLRRPAIGSVSRSGRESLPLQSPGQIASPVFPPWPVDCGVRVCQVKCRPRSGKLPVHEGRNVTAEALAQPVGRGRRRRPRPRRARLIEVLRREGGKSIRTC